MDDVSIVESEVVCGPDECKSFERGLRAGFIDATVNAADRYRPRLISNNKASGSDLLSAIKHELLSCNYFDICVAFVAESGLQPLVEVLSELSSMDVKGRILTSTYLNFNTPDMFRKLMDYKNIETRVYQGNLHAKGYVFDHDTTSTVIVGSSNLTQMALTCNHEWNILFRSFGAGGILVSLREEYERLWNDELTISLSEEWISSYQHYRIASKPTTNKPTYRKGIPLNNDVPEAICPNKMQTLALDALAKLHDRKEPRALLVSATGTGKTYLSAFDIALSLIHI